MGAVRSSAASRRSTTEWGAWVAATYGWTLLDLRAAEEARELLSTWRDRAERSGALAQRIRCHSLLAWAASLEGDREQARVSARAGRAPAVGGEHASG